MDLTLLKTRKAELELTMSQLSNQWQTCQGHISEVDYWISKLEKDESLASDDAFEVE